MVFRCISDFLGSRRLGPPESDGVAEPGFALAVDAKQDYGKDEQSGENGDSHSVTGSCSSGGSTSSTSPVAGRPPFQVKDAEPVTQASLEEFMKAVSLSVARWEPNSFVHVKTLQDAIKNHTHVDHMDQTIEGRVRSVAVKRLPNHWMHEGPEEFRALQPQAAERPWCDLGIVKYLNGIKCPFACDLLGIFRDEENTYAVTSLATQGNLFMWCDMDPRPGPDREAVIHPIAQQIFTAISAVHELGLAHRDISLENILLTKGGDGELQVKIIDFAMATTVRMCLDEPRGKPSYQAPEMHSDVAYDAFLADAFSLGVVLFGVAMKDYPWGSTKPDSCALFKYVQRLGLRKFLEKRRVRNGAPDEHLMDVMSPALATLLEGLLQTEPQKRFTLGESCFDHAGSQTSVWDAEWLSGDSSVGAHGVFRRSGSNPLAGG